MTSTGGAVDGIKTPLPSKEAFDFLFYESAPFRISLKLRPTSILCLRLISFFLLVVLIERRSFLSVGRRVFQFLFFKLSSQALSDVFLSPFA